MSATIVKVKIVNDFALRKIGAGYYRFHEVDPFVEKHKDGTFTEHSFKDEYGDDGKFFAIDNEVSLNMDNMNDRHNCEMLKLYLNLYPENKKIFIVEDPEDAIKAQLEQADKAYEIETYLRSNEKNPNTLAKVYRRIFGLATGLTERVIYADLLKTLKNEPEKFFVEGTTDRLIYQSYDFEILALLDMAIEKGILMKDTKGAILFKDGMFVAESIEGASHRVQADAQMKDNLERMVGNRTVVKDAMAYEPIIEKVDNAYIPDEVEVVTANTGKIASEVQEGEIAEALSEIAEAGYLAREGHGITTRYAILGLSQKFTKKELVSHFMQNPHQFRDLQDRARLEKV